METVLLPFANGTCCQHALDYLILTKNLKIKAGLRDPMKLKKRGANVEAVKFDINDPNTWRPAIKDCSVVFLMALPMDGNPGRYIKPLVDLCKEMHVKKIVFLSVINPEGLALHEMENYVKNSGLKYGILRPPFFMDNFITGFMSNDVEKGNFSAPSGDQKVSFISCKDIGHCIACMMTTERNDNQIIEITGPNPYSFKEIAEHISKVKGKTIKYTRVDESQFYKGASDAGMKSEDLSLLRGLYTAVNMDKNSKVTMGVEKITGHRPLTFDEFLTESNKISFPAQ